MLGFLLKLCKFFFGQTKMVWNKDFNFFYGYNIEILSEKIQDDATQAWTRKLNKFPSNCKKEMTNTEAATGGVLLKKVFLEILQNSQENICARVSFLKKLRASARQLYQKRDSGTGVLLCILRNSEDIFFTEHLSEWLLLQINPRNMLCTEKNPILTHFSSNFCTPPLPPPRP